MAELLTSAFYSDSLKLDEHDIAKMMMGEILTVGGLKIAYRQLPDNGCPCPNCRGRLSQGKDGGR